MGAPATKVDVKNINGKLDKMSKTHLRSTDEEVKTLRIENQDLKDHDRKLEAESGQMQEDINNLEQYGRRECLEFQELSCDESENTDQLVLGVSQLVQVDLSAKDISVSHRLSPASESNRQLLRPKNPAGLNNLAQCPCPRETRCKTSCAKRFS